MMKYYLTIICIAVILGACTNASTLQRESFHLSDVRLLESPFLHAQNLNKQYLLELDADRLLAPFLREAGLTPRAESYTNWENTGLDGHKGGHYVSALAIMYAATGDAQIKARLEYMISEWQRVQEANGNGYIGGVPGSRALWAEIHAGNIRPQLFNLNGRWVPLYNICKTFAGLRDAYLLAGIEEARGMLMKMMDWALWLVSDLTDEQLQYMLISEHGGLNIVFADAYEISGDPRHFELARRFSHHLILDPLLAREDRLTGLHANTQIPKAIGYKRVAMLGGDPEWAEAARFFWDLVVSYRSVSFGGNSSREHFHPADDFSQMIRSNEGPETCNTYNMLRLSKLLWQTSGDVRYIEFYERAMFNHILSTQHPETGGLVYFTQIRPGHYRVYSQVHTSMWCCTGTGIENHGLYGRMIYSHSGSNLFVNLFTPSELNWRAKNTVIVQDNNFPDEPRTTITVNPQRPTRFTLHIRYPEWVKDGALTVKVNGDPVSVTNIDGFVAINRRWSSGDRVEVELPMHLRTRQLPDGSPWFSFMYGPIVLAAKTGDYDLRGLFADDHRWAHVAHGRMIPLAEMPILISEPEDLVSHVTPVAGRPLTFTVSNLYPFDKWGSLELTPFFRLHDSRYIMYWRQSSEEEVANLQRAIEEEERERNRLNSITVSIVTAGQQQPESDHFIQFYRSEMGYTEGYHWRQALSRGYFSYQMNNRDRNARTLHLRFLEGSPNRQFNVLINGEVVQNIRTTGGAEDLTTLSIPIPENLRNNQRLVVRFEPVGNSSTGRVVEVRLLTE